MAKYNIPSTNNEFSRFIDKERPRMINSILSKSSLSREDAEEIFQDSAMALYNNINDKRLNNLEVPLKSYFSSICHRQMLKRIRDNKNYDMVSIDNISNIDDNQSIIKRRDPLSDIEINNWKYDDERIDELISMYPSDNISKQSDIIREIVKTLPEPCDTILWAYYESNMSMSEIATELNYKNATTAKSKKSQCMSKLIAKKDELMNRLYVNS